MLPDQTSASGTDQATTDRLAAFKAARGALELASVILPSPNERRVLLVLHIAEA